MELIRKTAAGKLPGKLTYVLSDATLDRYGDIIEPEGWELANFRRNPIALFGHSGSFPIGTWDNVRVEKGQLLGEFVPAKAGTSARVDEIISLINQDILRATSVGFHPIESEPLDPKDPWKGTRFLKQELLETSIVSVPANPATLQVARALKISDETMSLAFGVSAARRDLATTGEHARSNAFQRRSPMTTMTLSQQIEDRQTRLNAARDALTELTRDPEHDGEQATIYQNEIDQHEDRLVSLQRSEQSLAARAGQQHQQQEVFAPGSKDGYPRRPLNMPAPAINKRDFLWKAATVHALAQATHRSIDDILRERYPDDEATAIITRAAVAGATTTAAGWAAELVVQAPGDFLANLTPNAVFPALAALGTGLNFGPGAGSIKIPSRATTPSIGAAFVAEGAPIPVRRLGLTSITLTPHKVGGLSVMSREIAKYSSPQIEGIIRDGITDDTSINIDALLLDNVAGSVVRPAGLTNGVVALTATAGGGYAAILGDIQKLTAPFFAVNAGRKLALLINPAQGQQLDFAPGPSGVPFGWAQQFTNRYSVIESTSIAAGSVYMIDAFDFVSVSGAAEFEVSETATLHMEDTTPLHIGTTGTPPVVAAPVQSMFQTAQIAIRMLADVTWAMRRAGMVQFMTGVNWG